MFELASKGDQEGLRVFSEWKYIIKSYFKLMNDSYEPDIFVVTGGLMKSKDMFFDEIKESLPDVEVSLCHFSEQAGLMGSAVYAFQKAK